MALPCGTTGSLCSCFQPDRLVGLSVKHLSPQDRLALLLDGQPKRALGLALRYRYLALAFAVNTPGNSIIGGGGGIMMMAGLSGIFSPLATFLTIAVAVSPVPLAMMFLGLQI